MKVLFYGFQHGHIFALYEKVKKCEELEIVACIEDDAAKRETLESAYGIPCVDGGLDAWLQSDVDIVAIGDKYGRRGAAVIKALRAGKHVIVDKPLCTSIDELSEIITLSREKDLKVGCMFELRGTGGAYTLGEILRTERYGALKNIMFTGNHSVDYAHRPSWYFDEGMHGGTINDIAIHAVDIITYLTGLKFTKINGARTWNAFADKTPDFMDSAVFMAELAGGIGVIGDVSYSAPASQAFRMPTYWDFKFWCKNALVSYSLTKDEVTVYEEGKKEPEVLTNEGVGDDYLACFMSDFKNNERVFTESVLLATMEALKLQEYADKAEACEINYIGV